MFPVAILAGGLATRMRPLTETVPKSLLPVGGEPFIAHQLRLLADVGVDRVVLCTGHLGRQIEDYVDDGARFGLEVVYSADGDRLLGTGGALRKALPLLGDNFFTLYGDSYLPCDWRAVQASFLAAGQPALMTVFRNDGRLDTSNVELADGRILRYDKRHRSRAMRHIDYGLGVFNARTMEATACERFGEKFDLADLYRTLAERGQLACHEVAERFYEIGSPTGLREFATCGADLVEPRVVDGDPGATGILPVPDVGQIANLPFTRQIGDLPHDTGETPVAPHVPRRAVFLDRDGVLNRCRIEAGCPHPPRTEAEVEILPGVAEALLALKAAGFLTLVVTNQPDVARAAQSRGMVERINARLGRRLAIDEFLVCYHDDRAHCVCRKPRPGLLLEAARRHGIDLAESFMVGDRWRDVEAGRRAGCRTIFIDYGYAERRPDPAPHRVVGSLVDAAAWILREISQQQGKEAA
jgi:histidinol-phosphate phosphatase family protein